MTHDIFISYSSEDREVAEKVCQILEEREIRCWHYKRDNDGSWSEGIVDAINDCPAMVYLISTNSNDSTHTLNELTEAINLKKKIFPVRIEDVMPSKGIKFLINSINWMDAITPPIEKHIITIAAKIQQHLSAGNANEWLTKGNEYCEQNQYLKAIEAYDRAVAIDPKKDEAWHNKSFALNNLSRHQEAIEACKQAIAIEPKNVNTWNNLCFALNNLSRHQEVIEACKQAIAIEPKNAIAWNNLGVALANLGQHQEAIEACKQAIAIEPKNAIAWNNLGVALANLGQHQEAIEAYNRSLTIDPQQSSVRKNGEISQKALQGGAQGIAE